MILFFCCNSHWKEFEALVRLSIPSIVINSLEMGITLTDLIMLGHLGKGDLAGACVAFAYFNMIWYLIEGVLTAQDTLCAAAFGKRDYEALRYWTFVSFFIVIFLCTAGTVGLLFSPLVIPCVFGVNLRTSIKVGNLTISSLHYYITIYISAAYKSNRNNELQAIEQLMISIHNLWVMGLFRVLQKYLQSQNVMQPSVSASVIGVVVNLVGMIFMTSV
jgi:Na+-driven multidrug efflux pump